MELDFTQEPLLHYQMDRFILKSPVIYHHDNFVLSVGGGPNRNHPKEVNLNIVPMENVEVVATAESLPFKDNSVDVIISNAVLEHVEDLSATIDEFKRVLKPGGFVYIEVPFMQHYHTHDVYGVKFEDYRRLTLPGLKRLFHFCTHIDSGACVGPTSAVLQIVFTYLEDLFPSESYKKAAKKLYYYIGNIFSQIDSVLPDQVIKNSRIPSGIYYFGRKKDRYTERLESLPEPNSLFPSQIKAEITLKKQTEDQVEVNIKNVSDTTWLKASPLAWGTVAVGIQSVKNGLVNKDFKRFFLSDNIVPSASFDLSLTLNELRNFDSILIDLVNEGLCWFEQHGTAPLEVRLT